MDTVKYLAVSRNGSIRVVAKLDSVRGAEVPIRVTLTIPDLYWEVPLCSTSIVLPDLPDNVSEINAAVTFVTAEPEEEENLDDI